MTTIYFLRHGEVRNPQKILYGKLPGFGLSVKGISQVKKIAQDFEDNPVDYIYTSPLQRTRQTTQILAAKLRLRPIVSDLITEVELFCEGVAIKEYHESIQSDLYSEKNIRLGQETISSVEKRMEKFLNSIVEKHPDKNVLVVSHGDPIMILKARLQKRPFTWKYKKENYLSTGKYFTLQVDRGRYIWK